MRTQETEYGYRMWLSAADTMRWARKPGASWPCSVLAGRPLFVAVDTNGLYDYTIDCRRPATSSDITAEEIEAIVGDHLRGDLRRYWPTWEFTAALLA